jgi:hypothetical protein
MDSGNGSDGGEWTAVAAVPAVMAMALAVVAVRSDAAKAACMMAKVSCHGARVTSSPVAQHELLSHVTGVLGSQHAFGPQT